MIHIQLERPVLLMEQIPEIAERTGRSKEDILALVFGTKYILTRTHKDLTKGSIVSDADISEHTLPLSDCLTGTPALVWLMKQKKAEFSPLSCIDIPSSVYFEYPRQFRDITELAAKADRQNSRLGKCLAMQVPDIIIRHETRKLTEAVNALQDASWMVHPPVHEVTGRMLRSLSDLGYSLLSGWDAAMEQEFERRRQQVKEEFDRMTETDEAADEAPKS